MLSILLLGDRKVRQNLIFVFTVLIVTIGYPKSLSGTSDIFEAEQDSCLERCGRYGAYGLGINISHFSGHWEDDRLIDWDEVNWVALQSQCLKLNRKRSDLRLRPMPGTKAYQGNNPSSNALKKRHAIFFAYLRDLSTIQMFSKPCARSSRN